MKEVKISIPKGYVIDKENSTFECIKFKKANFPKTWKEFCKMYPAKDDEVFIDSNSKIQELRIWEERRDPLVDANLLPNKEYAEAMLALCQLIQLRDYYNEGWQPDWTDRTQSKYCIIIYNNGTDFHTSCYISHILAFKTEKIRNEFLSNFKDIIEKAKILL